MGWGLLLKYKCSYQYETENIGLTTFWFSIRGIQGEDWNVGAASSLLIARGLRVGRELVKDHEDGTDEGGPWTLLRGQIAGGATAQCRVRGPAAPPHGSRIHR